jgi:hypothetical protein
MSAVAGDQLTVIGVRHHSPACAGLVKRTIEATRPAFVLIEGPSDFNPHLGDLKLAHEPPIAIFSFFAAELGTRASYTPFCAYSPEWQALQSAWGLGAKPLFCDLPAWAPEFGDRVNRYADPHSARAEAAETALARALGEDGHDAVWDALAEQADSQDLPARLDRYFDLLRPEGAEDPGEAAREDHMGRYAAWAVKQAKGRPVVLVCGGWHAEAIRRIARDADGMLPISPEVPQNARVGSYVVPYEYARLDRFTGYAAGMPSPAYYEHVQAKGLAVAADWAASAITSAMRKAGQVVSTADLVAWHAHAEALARARGHAAVLRADLLDGALATLIKDGLDAPADWTRAGAVKKGSHPALVAMLRAMSGDRRGRLAAGARQPPLVTDVEARLAETDLTPTHAQRRVEIDWNRPEDRSRAHVLHGLRLLGMPGIERLDGPQRAEARAPVEAFRIVAHRDALGALIEASRWGGALSMAAASALAARIEAAGGDLAAIAVGLSDALFAGLVGVDDGLLARLEDGVARTHEIGPIGKVASSVVRLYRFGDVFGPASHGGLARISAAVFARTLWLFEGIDNDDEALKAIDAMLAARDMVRDCLELAIDRPALLEALSRIVADDARPPALAGAALGCRIACGEAEADGAAQRIRRFGRPEQLGDFLSGLFSLSREELADSEPVTDVVTRLVAGWAEDDFLRALPAMRQAFAWFPPRERERLARAILRRHGVGEAAAGIEALAWMRQGVGVADQAAALALEARTAARLERAGLT